MNITFDPAAALDIEFRKNRHGSKLFTFLDSAGAAFDVSGIDFRLNIKSSANKSQNILQLSNGSGLSYGASNEITVTLTAPQTNIQARKYYWELYNNNTSETWLSGIFHLYDSVGDPADTDIQVTVRTTPNNVLVTVSASNEIKQTTVSLSSAQIRAFPTLVDCIPAPGVGFYTSLIQVDFLYTFITPAYTRNSSASMRFSYEGVGIAGIGNVGAILTDTASSYNMSSNTNSTNSIARTVCENKKIQVGVNAGSFTLGNGTLKLKILYRTVAF